MSDLQEDFIRMAAALLNVCLFRCSWVTFHLARFLFIWSETISFLVLHLPNYTVGVLGNTCGVVQVDTSQELAQSSVHKDERVLVHIYSS